MNPKELAGRYMEEGKVMQLATLHDDQPRANSLYYVASRDLRFVYWLSEATRRHSLDIVKNPLVGGAIVVKADLPVVGIQFSGEASKVIDHDEQKEVLEQYNEKYGDTAKGLYERMVAGKNKHHLYKIAIRELELFDEVNFLDESPVSISLS